MDQNNFGTSILIQTYYYSNFKFVALFFHQKRTNDTSTTLNVQGLKQSAVAVPQGDKLHQTGTVCCCYCRGSRLECQERIVNKILHKAGMLQPTTTGACFGEPENLDTRSCLNLNQPWGTSGKNCRLLTFDGRCTALRDDVRDDSVVRSSDRTSRSVFCFWSTTDRRMGQILNFFLVS